MSINVKKTFASIVVAGVLAVGGGSASFAASCIAVGAASQEMVNNATANPAAFLAAYATKEAMSDAVRTIVASDSSLAATLLRASANLNLTPEQKAGLGAGLARAAKVCEPSHIDAATEIQTAVTDFTKDNPAGNRDLLVAFNATMGGTATAALGGAAAGGAANGGAAINGTPGTGTGGTNGLQGVTGGTISNTNTTGTLSTSRGGSGGSVSTTNFSTSGSTI